MYSVTLLDHFHNPRNAGELAPPAVTVEVGNPACGDVLRLSIMIERGLVRELRFKAKGCVPAIACGSLLTEIVSGKSVEAAAQLTAAEIESGIGSLPSASSHAAILAIDALKQALKSASELRP